MQKNLYRSCDNQVFGGVAAGLGEYFDIDASLVRLVLVIIALMGIGIALYVIAWIIIPLNPSCNSKKTGAEEIKEKAEKIAQDIEKAAKNRKEGRDHDGKKIFGGIILIVGLMLLFQNIFGVNIWKNFWPIILILIGVAVMFNSIKR